MARQFSTWSAIWRRLVIWTYVSSLIPPKVLSATVMQTSQGCGTRHLHQWTPVLPSHKVVGSFSMQDACLLGLQTSIPVAMSTTEAEYIAMSQALREVIPIMGLLQEMREQDFKVLCTKPYVSCKAFEDNSGTLELARLPKLCPRTEHINVYYHHFCEHVQKGLIKIFPVDTKDQIADALTKPLAQNDFQCHRPLMCGKWPPQATKVMQCYVMRNFGTYFTGTYVFLLVPRESAFLHDSVRYQNIRSRDPITLLSMDIVVETFLEIGVSDLLVLTWHLQDPLYLELWETYLSLSIGPGKQNFMISHDISLIMSVVE